MALLNPHAGRRRVPAVFRSAINLKTKAMKKKLKNLDRDSKCPIHRLAGPRASQKRLIRGHSRCITLVRLERAQGLQE